MGVGGAFVSIRSGNHRNLFAIKSQLQKMIANEESPLFDFKILRGLINFVYGLLNLSRKAAKIIHTSSFNDSL